MVAVFPRASFSHEAPLLACVLRVRIQSPLEAQGSFLVSRDIQVNGESNIAGGVPVMVSGSLLELLLSILPPTR